MVISPRCMDRPRGRYHKLKRRKIWKGCGQTYNISRKSRFWQKNRQEWMKELWIRELKCYNDVRLYSFVIIFDMIIS